MEKRIPNTMPVQMFCTSLIRVSTMITEDVLECALVFSTFFTVLVTT